MLNHEPATKLDDLTKARHALESGQLEPHSANLLRVALILADDALSNDRRAEAQAEWDALKATEGEEPISNDPDHEIAKAARRFGPTEG
jgi:hypothetical protein